VRFVLCTVSIIKKSWNLPVRDYSTKEIFGSFKLSEWKEGR
jgi:hypothetical protein